eukprot:1159156-Pelagomonas_calceolata.AAC.15
MALHNKHHSAKLMHGIAQQAQLQCWFEIQVNKWKCGSGHSRGSLPLRDSNYEWTRAYPSDPCPAFPPAAFPETVASLYSPQQKRWEKHMQAGVAEVKEVVAASYAEGREQQGPQCSNNVKHLKNARNAFQGHGGARALAVVIQLVAQVWSLRGVGTRAPAHARAHTHAHTHTHTNKRTHIYISGLSGLGADTCCGQISSEWDALIEVLLTRLPGGPSAFANPSTCGPQQQQQQQQQSQFKPQDPSELFDTPQRNK